MNLRHVSNLAISGIHLETFSDFDTTLLFLVFIRLTIKIIIVASLVAPAGTFDTAKSKVMLEAMAIPQTPSEL